MSLQMQTSNWRAYSVWKVSASLWLRKEKDNMGSELRDAQL